MTQSQALKVKTLVLSGSVITSLSISFPKYVFGDGMECYVKYLARSLVARRALSVEVVITNREVSAVLTGNYQVTTTRAGWPSLLLAREKIFDDKILSSRLEKC